MGVWVSIRMESTLKLFHAVTHEHLQDLNPEASIIRIIGQSCRMNFLRVTFLSYMADSLWIGTNFGIIVTFPVGEGQFQSCKTCSKHMKNGNVSSFFR